MHGNSLFTCLPSRVSPSITYTDRSWLRCAAAFRRQLSTTGKGWRRRKVNMPIVSSAVTAAAPVITAR